MAPKTGRQTVINIVRKNPNNISAVYANDMSATYSDNELFITFSLIEPPSILTEADIDKVKELEAVSVAKLVVTPEFAATVVKVLSNLVQNQEAKDNK